jgi:seryl-tRNA synthetase
MSTRATEALKKENEELKSQCKRIDDQSTKLNKRIDEKFDSRRSSIQAESNVELKDIQFLSDEYDELQSFRNQTKSQLSEYKKTLNQITEKVMKVESAIDAIEQYSYKYNVKIIGVPQTSTNESSEVTAMLCLEIFKAMGVQGLTIQDIDTAHRVPQRRNFISSSTNDGSNPIICKFTRRLAKEAVMSKRKEIKKVSCSSLGISQQHLSMQLQWEYMIT